MSASPVPDIDYEINEARDAVTLSIGAVRMTLDASQLANLLKFLGAMRAAMSPAVDPELPGDAFLQVEAPRVIVLPGPEQRHAAVIARTPQYGWIAFHLDREQADGIGRHLTRLASDLPSTN